MKSDKKPDVAVIGLGYIGLPTAAVVVRSGCRVFVIAVPTPFAKDHAPDLSVCAIIKAIHNNGLQR